MVPLDLVYRAKIGYKIEVVRIRSCATNLDGRRDTIRRLSPFQNLSEFCRKIQ
jgi:hypothetical protein